MTLFDTCNFYCINLDERTDRWKAVSEEFNILAVNSQLIRKSAKQNVQIENEKLSFGEHSLIETNIELLNEVPEDRFVCIFEDDVYFLDHYSLDLMKSVTEQIPDDFDVLYLGAHLFDDLKHPRISENLIHLLPEPNPTPEKDHIFIGGAHAILYSPRAIAFIRSLSRKELFEDQWDIFISKYVVPRNKSFMVYPPFAFQKEDISDLEGKLTRRNWIVSHNEKRISHGQFSKNPLIRLFSKLKKQ